MADLQTCPDLCDEIPKNNLETDKFGRCRKSARKEIISCFGGSPLGTSLCKLRVRQICLLTLLSDVAGKLADEILVQGWPARVTS